MEIPHELDHCFLYPLSHSSAISGWIHKAWLLARSSMLISVSWERIPVFADSLLCCRSDQFGDVTDKSFHIIRGIKVLQEEQSSFGIACDRKMPKTAEFCIKHTRNSLGPFLIPKPFFICYNLQVRPRLLPATTQFTGVSFKPQTDGS